VIGKPSFSFSMRIIFRATFSPLLSVPLYTFSYPTCSRASSNPQRAV
jgi:hypothetical protein